MESGFRGGNPRAGPDLLGKGRLQQPGPVRLLQQPRQSRPGAALQLEKMTAPTSTPPPCPPTQLETGFRASSHEERSTSNLLKSRRPLHRTSVTPARGAGVPLLTHPVPPGRSVGHPRTGRTSPDSDVREQSQHRKGRGEQLSNDKRFQLLLTEAGFNLAGKGFVSHYQPAAPVTSLPSCVVLTSFLKINDELFSPCNE